MDKREYVQDAIDRSFALWLRRGAVSGALIFLLLSFLDFTVFPGHFKLFLVYRIAIALFLLLILGLTRKTTNKTALRSYGLAAVTASALTIEAMILHTGGDHSLYAMGMILLTVTVLAFVPADLAFHSAMAGVIYGVYLLPIIMTQGIEDLPTFFTTNFFMCSIILTVLFFRYMSMQTIRQQLATEYELIAAHNTMEQEIIGRKMTEETLQEYQEHLEEMVEKRTAEVVESELRYQNLFELSGDAIIVTDMETGIVVDANQKARELLNRDPGELIGLHQSALHPPGDATRYQKLFLSRETKNQPLSEDQGRDFIVLKKNGRHISVEIRANRLELHGQTILVNVLKDLSLTKMQEKELIVLKKSIDILPLGVTIVDNQGSIIYVNNAEADLHGYERADLIGKQPRIYAPPDRMMGTRADGTLQSDDLLTNGYTRESENIRKDGSVFPVEISSVPVRDSGGKLIALISICKNITERKLADKALKESEERFKKLLDNAPVAISIVNKAGIVEYVNRKHPEILGYDLQDIPTLEHWWAQAYPDETDRTNIKTAWDKITRRIFQGEKITNVHRKVVCKDGTSKYVEMNFRAAGDKIIITFGDITERIQAEEKLLESELHYRTLFEKASEGIIFITESGTIAAVNEAFARMHGFCREDILHKHINDLDCRKSFGHDQDLLRRLMTGESALIEAEHCHAAGHAFPVEVSISLVNMRDQNYFLCFHHDISNRKKAERELQQEEARMRAMLESFDGLIYICSPDYRVEFMNESLIRRMGRNAVGEKCHAVMNSRDTICPWCVNERVFSGEIVRYEIQSPVDQRWYHVVNTPIRHDNESVSKLATFLDITETKEAELALQESELRYRRLVRSVTDYIYKVTVEDGRPVVTEHGEGCFAVTGYTAEQYEEDPNLWYRIVYEADRESILAQVETILTGKKTVPLEHRIVHRNGSIRWVRHVIAPLFDKDQKLLSFDGLISDITEKKLLEEQLEKARMQQEENQKVFSRLLLDVQEEERRSIARELHDEIGQSLTGLKLSVENIADSLPIEQADEMRPIEVSLGELISLVRRISLNLRPAMLDDFGLINTLRWYFERYKAQTGIAVEFIRGGSDRRFDPQKEIALYRTAQESLTNVARYAGVKDVLVELNVDQDRVTLRVKDEGQGFHMSNEMLFVSSGLSIMRERSILLNGTFSLSSAPGKGTEIIAVLPLYDAGDGLGGLM